MEFVLSAPAGSGDIDKQVDACEAGGSVEACIVETASGTLSALMLGCGAELNELCSELPRGWSGFGVECFWLPGAWPGARVVEGAGIRAGGGCPIGLGPWEGRKGSSICPVDCLGAEAGSSCPKETTLPNCTPGCCCSPDG